ncbi:MAG: ACP S-malonyltransferase [Alphaproteobacteria bacterium]
MTSIIFPGQGSQFLGMTKDFYDNFSIAKDTITEIEDVTNIDIKKIIFGDDDNLLNITNFTQISIFAASMSIYQTIEKNFGVKNLNINNMLGHSLGEYSSLAASKSLTIAQASSLLKIRGELMNSAIEPNTTKMAALIGLNCENISQIIKKNNVNVEIANDNSPTQIVISGSNNDIDNSEKIFLSNGINKFIKLNVSAAFHSKFMTEAQNKLNFEIDKINFVDPICSIVSNYDASIQTLSYKIIENLKLQMSNRVRWTESILNIEESGENQIIEIGPGKVLSGLIKRITKKFDIISINNIQDIEQLKKI